MLEHIRKATCPHEVGLKGMQVAAEISTPPSCELTSWQVGSLHRLLVLDCLQDPGNMVSSSEDCGC